MCCNFRHQGYEKQQKILTNTPLTQFPQIFKKKSTMTMYFLSIFTSCDITQSAYNIYHIIPTTSHQNASWLERNKTARYMHKKCTKLRGRCALYYFIMFHLNGKKDRMKKGWSSGSSGLKQVSVRGRGRIIIFWYEKNNFCLLTFLSLSLYI